MNLCMAFCVKVKLLLSLFLLLYLSFILKHTQEYSYCGGVQQLESGADYSPSIEPGLPLAAAMTQSNLH